MTEFLETPLGTILYVIVLFIGFMLAIPIGFMVLAIIYDLLKHVFGQDKADTIVFLLLMLLSLIGGGMGRAGSYMH